MSNIPTKVSFSGYAKHNLNKFDSDSMKKTSFTILFFLASLFGYSQDLKPAYQYQYRLGFNMGVNYSLLSAPQGLPDSSSINNGMGLKIGLIMDYKWKENWTISPKAELSFNKSSVKTQHTTDQASIYQVFPASFDIMTHFHYQLNQKNPNTFLLFGPKYSFSIPNPANIIDDFPNKDNLSFDFGIGRENIKESFMLSPELRFSVGILDVNNNPLLKKLMYHSISLVINFS